MSVQLSTLTLPDGVDIFYRSAGLPAQQVILLLHGFPASSFQYRHLIPLLAAQGYHVIAPDLPGFGFTTFPPQYQHTFDNLSTTIETFIDQLGISKFTAYVFDYGAPTLYRLALRRPELINAIVTQNGNAYVEGLGKDGWAVVEQYWKTDSKDDRKKVEEALLSFEGTRWGYVHGVPGSLATQIDPATYNLDYGLMQRSGNIDIQLDLFKDYETNLKLYPKFQEYFRNSKVPILGVWGRNDEIFLPEGLEAFRRDSPDIEIHFLDGGHFLVETHVEQISGFITDFLKRKLSI